MRHLEMKALFNLNQANQTWDFSFNRKGVKNINLIIRLRKIHIYAYKIAKKRRRRIQQGKKNQTRNERRARLITDNSRTKETLTENKELTESSRMEHKEDDKQSRIRKNLFQKI